MTDTLFYMLQIFVADKQYSSMHMRDLTFFYTELDLHLRLNLGIVFPSDLIHAIYFACYRCTHLGRQILCENCNTTFCSVCFSIDRAQCCRCWKCGSFMHEDLSFRQLMEYAPVWCPSIFIPDDHLEDELVRALRAHYFELLPTHKMQRVEQLLGQILPVLWGYDLETIFSISEAVAQILGFELSRRFFDENWSKFIVRVPTREIANSKAIVDLVDRSPTYSSTLSNIFVLDQNLPDSECAFGPCVERNITWCFICKIPLCSYHCGLQSGDGDDCMSCCQGICPSCVEQVHVNHVAMTCFAMCAFTHDQTAECILHVHPPPQLSALHTNPFYTVVMAEERVNASESISFAIHLLKRHMEMENFNLWSHNALRMSLGITPILASEWFHLVSLAMCVPCFSCCM